MNRTSLLLSLALFAPAGCGWHYADPPHDAGSGGSSGSGGAGGEGGAGGAPECPEAHFCAPFAASEWKGPVVIASRQAEAPAPDCPAEYPEAMLDLINDFVFEPAACECSCKPVPHGCGPLELNWWEACGTFNIKWWEEAQGPAGACVATTPMGGTGFAPNLDDLAFSKPCTPMGSQSLLPPSAASATRACGSAEEKASCGIHGACVPEPKDPFSTVCVYRVGEYMICPPKYPVRRVDYGAMNDARKCAPCQCGAPSDPYCATSIHPFTDAACTTPAGPSIYVTHPGGCLATSFSYYKYEPITNTPHCDPLPQEPLGAVEGKDAHTFCCLE